MFSKPANERMNTNDAIPIRPDDTISTALCMLTTEKISEPAGTFIDVQSVLNPGPRG